MTSSGGYLKAMAQRGARDVAPSLALQGHLVDLDDDPVDLVRAVVPVLPVVGHELLNRGDVGQDAHLVGRRQPPGAEGGIPLALALDVEAAARADAVHEHAQRAGGRDLGVLLAQGARGGVAWVGERRLARLDEARVEVGERRRREEHLAADLDEVGHVVARQTLGDALDGAHVVGDVLAGAAVTAGQGTHEAPLLVEQVDGQAVDLQAR